MHLDHLTEFCGLSQPKAVGAPCACLWCEQRFRPVRANQEYCSPECKAEAKRFREAYGPALAEPIIVLAAWRKRGKGTPERRAADEARAWLLRRGRELRDLKAERIAAMIEKRKD